MTPSEFIDEYVNPAINLWQEDTNSKVLAVCALSQLDILAEVVFNYLQSGGKAPAKDASSYRIGLAQIVPAIGWVADAHDAHKHGSLRNGARQFSSGLVQISTAGTAFFVDDSFLGADFLGETDTSLKLNNGHLVSVAELIRDVRVGWEAEFVARSLPPWHDNPPAQLNGQI